MKWYGWAILILSVLLAASVVTIVIMRAGSTAAAEKAKADMAAAQREIDVAAWAAGLLDKNLTEKDRIIERSSKTMIAQSATIKSLTADIAAAHDITAAVIVESADLVEAYEAGASIVEQAGIPALADWYELLGVRVQVVPGRLGTLEVTIIEMAGKIGELAVQNESLSADNLSLKALQAIDKDLISQLELSTGLAELDLKSAQGHVDDMAREILIKNILLGVAGLIIAGETAYITGHALTWW